MKNKGTLVAGWVSIGLGILVLILLITKGGFCADQLTPAEVLALKIYDSQLTQEKLRADLQPLQTEFAKLAQEVRDEKNEKVKAEKVGKLLEIQEKLQPMFEKLNIENAQEQQLRTQRKALTEGKK